MTERECVLRERERKRVCVCVCAESERERKRVCAQSERERERERKRVCGLRAREREMAYSGFDARQERGGEGEQKKRKLRICVKVRQARDSACTDCDIILHGSR
jgi:hypothetical protein